MNLGYSYRSNYHESQIVRLSFMFRILSVFILSLFVAACATAIDKPTQDVRVETPGALGAICFLESSSARYKIRPPQTVRITKQKGPVDVRCIAPGNRNKTVTVDPQVPDSVMLNISNAIVPGVAVDYSTSAMFTLPEVIVVDFSDIPPAPMPLPDYHQTILKNPTIADVEEFRPGIPAMQSDRYTTEYELQPRQNIPGQVNASDNVISGSSVSENTGSGLSGMSADTLTRQMNPDVFDGTPSFSDHGGASNAPTLLTPPSE